MVRERKYIMTGSSGGRRIASLVPAFAFAFTVAIALPVSMDTGFSMNGAFAAGNAGGKGKGKALGLAGAPGQQPDQVADTDEHAGLSGGATAEAGGGEIAEETLLVPTDAKNRVVQELAGLPESSALSEEEELEAIRSGWGTWRTADGPNRVTTQ